MRHAAPNDRDDGERAGAALDQDGFFCDDPKPSFGHLLVLVWIHFGAFLDTFGAILATFWCWFGYLFLLWALFGVGLDTFWRCF